jgi:hypothetical protein
MRLPHDTLGGTLAAGLLLTAVLYLLVRSLV